MKARTNHRVHGVHVRPDQRVELLQFHGNSPWQKTCESYGAPPLASSEKGHSSELFDLTR